MTAEEKLDYAETVIKNLIHYHKENLELQRDPHLKNYYSGLIQAYESCLDAMKGDPYARGHGTEK